MALVALGNGPYRDPDEFMLASLAARVSEGTEKAA
jgi:hypothetical protein